jgi:hypothetical protein
MQVQILNADDVSESEFNQFCRQQLQQKLKNQVKIHIHHTAYIHFDF